MGLRWGDDDGSERAWSDGLKAKYPQLFTQKHRWRPEIDRGWRGIIERLCENVAALAPSRQLRCLGCNSVAGTPHPVIEEPGPEVWREPGRVRCRTERLGSVSFGIIKQKLGWLNINVYPYGDEEIGRAIDAACSEAEHTCEGCGGEGRRVTIDHWISVLCPVCEAVAGGWQIEVLGPDGKG